MYRLIFTTASLATLALARTDLTGCTSTDVSSPAGASIAWYVPGTGELCDFLDCGGGRAPPKTTVPGCPQYSGTATYSPSYLPGYGAMETGAAPATSSSSATVSASETGEPTFYAQTTGTEITTSTSNTNVASSSFSAAVETTPITSAATISTSQTPVVGGGTASNGTTTTVAGSGSGTRNGTVVTTGTRTTSGTASAQTGAAMETARVWVGGVAMIGIGAIVAAL